MGQARKVRYADSGERQIAYEIIGDGPIDIVTALEHGSNLDLVHEHPRLDAFLRGIGSFGRLIHMDPRGVGLSDAMEQDPPLEDWVEDVRSVMTAAGSGRAALLGHGYSAQMFMMFAAMHPDLTSGLVTINGYARLRQAPDYPGGVPDGVAETLLRLMAEGWGTGAVLGSFNPGMAEAPREWIARLERGSATPRRAVLRQRIAMDIDVRDVLPTISAPTLVIQSADDGYIRADHGRYLADHIAGARYHELPGADHSPIASAAAYELVEVVGSFLTGSSRHVTSDRVLKTVAFTDIVSSTETAAHLGDRRWRSTLETYEDVARREIEGSGGRLVKSTGDGSMATFDGPARAVNCLQAIGRRVQPLGLSVRAGVHTGEVEAMGDDVGGIAVHIAARIAALADGGEVLASSTVRDLVAGSGIVFTSRGEHALKGVPDPWHVFAVAE